MIIYKATNKINGKSYIGQTKFSLKQRKKQHFRSNNEIYFHRALKKYGEKNFEWEIIENCNSKEELDEMEFHYIKQYNTFGKNGYNLTFGGDGSWDRVISKITRKKISKANKGKMAWNKGLTKETDDRIKKQSEKQKGHKHSKETIKKLQINNKKRTNDLKTKKNFIKRMNSEEIYNKRKQTMLKNESTKLEKNGRWKNISKEEFQELYYQGLSYKKIQEILDVSQPWITRRIKHWELTPRKRPKNKNDVL